jgi:hypothetical protein
MFLPTSDVDCFVTEVAERIHEADMFDRYVGTPRTALSHLATTPSGFKSLMGEPLDTFFQFSGIIHTLCVVDITCNGRFNFRDLENASKYRLFDLEGAPNALLTWRCSRRQWEETSGDDEMLTQLKELVLGVDEPYLSTTDFDLEVRLLHVVTSGKESKRCISGVLEPAMVL